MNRSISKIRHIQESNLRLERRMLKEQGASPLGQPTPEDKAPSNSNQVGDVTGDLKNKTFNVYDSPNEDTDSLVGLQTILKITKWEKEYTVYTERKKVDGGGWASNYSFSCGKKSLEDLSMDRELYSTNFVNELTKRFCTKSATGATVPNADFAKP